jgi:hypothetical protein
VGARVVIPAWWLFIAKYFGLLCIAQKRAGAGVVFLMRTMKTKVKNKFIVFVRKLLLGIMFYLMMDKAGEKLFGCAVREKRIPKTKLRIHGGGSADVVAVSLFFSCCFFINRLHCGILLNMWYKHTCLYFETSKLLIYGNISSITRC